MSFKRLDPEDFLISADSITAGAWTGDSPTLTSFNKSTTQEASDSGQYYLNVYQVAASETNAQVQFNIAYGDSKGSGSVLFDSGIDGKSPTSAIYGQFQNVVLGDENTDFNFGGTNIDRFYALVIDRARFKGSILPGTMTLEISGAMGQGDQSLYLTDNSKVVSANSFNEAGRVFQLLSGSAGTITTSTITDDAGNTYEAGYTPSGSYGLFLPDIGTLLLNPAALDLPPTSGGVNLGTTRNKDSNDDNNGRLFTKLEDSNARSFTLNSQENLTSNFVFIRARNSEFNYSANPSYISGSTGELVFDDFVNNPTTYITTVGLYNDENELLATAKLSKPLKKDFTKEALIRVKLDF
jgi:hypothetical protein